MMQNQNINLREINLEKFNIPCYFFGYFKAPGLNDYPSFAWVNDDYNLIKSQNLSEDTIVRMANNLFFLGQKYNLFEKIDYIVLMPLKASSISNMEAIIKQLIVIAWSKLSIEIQLMTNLFLIKDYRKFWENKLNYKQRKQEISDKITLKPEYQNFLNNKRILIVDDIISTGISIINLAKQLLDNNKNLSLSVLCYGSVYNWEKIYGNY